MGLKVMTYMSRKGVHGGPDRALCHIPVEYILGQRGISGTVMVCCACKFTETSTHEFWV